MSIKNERLLSKAKKLAKKGEVDQARQIYSKILKSFPNNLEAKKGLLFLDSSTKLSPTKEQLDNVINLYSSGKLKEAITSVQALIEN